MQKKCRICGTINNIDEGCESFCTGCGRSLELETKFTEVGAVVFEKNIKSVVEIYKKGQPGGTGFIISDKGYLVTNYHVIWDEQNRCFAKELCMRFKDTTTIYSLEVVDANSNRDIAVAFFDRRKVIDFKPVKCADYTNVKVGSVIYIIGNTRGRGIDICSGIIRDTRKKNSNNDLVTDAPSNPGNSGSPIFNIKGEVIGLHKAGSWNFLEDTIVEGKRTVDVTRNVSYGTPIDEVLDFIEICKKKHRFAIL